MSAKRLSEEPEQSVRCKTLTAHAMRSSSVDLSVARERVDRYGRRSLAALDDPTLLGEVLGELRSQTDQLTDAQQELVTGNLRFDRVLAQRGDK